MVYIILKLFCFYFVVCTFLGCKYNTFFRKYTYNVENNYNITAFFRFFGCFICFYQNLAISLHHHSLQYIIYITDKQYNNKSQLETTIQ